MFKSEVIKKTLNPTWAVATTGMQQLCNGDPYRPLLIECFDWNADGSNELIGSVTTSVDDLAKRVHTGVRGLIAAVALSCLDLSSLALSRPHCPPPFRSCLSCGSGATAVGPP